MIAMADANWRHKIGASFGDERFRTLFLVNLAGIMERADESLLPGVYREIGLEMHATPAALGSLTLLRSIVQIFCFPVAAYLSVHHNRASVIALGAMLWAFATFFVGISSSFLQVAVSRALNGIGLAVVIPAIQSMVADSTDEGNRGWAFGWLQFTGNAGSIIGNICSVLLAGTTVFGIAGWRVSFHLIAAISIVVGVLVYKFAIDPRFSESAPDGLYEIESRSVSNSWSALKETLLDAKRVVRIPTFLVIVAQGVAGNFPWAALSFTPMWLELIGFSHNVTAIIMGVFIASNSLGGLFGGRMGDILSKRLPNTGRIVLAQISSSLGVPLGAILLLVLPIDPSTAVLHGSLFFIMGFLISWCATATNNPIFAEIVPEKSRTSIYALDRSFESVLAAFAPPLVGILAQNVYGYVPPRKNSSNDEGLRNRDNAVALAKALYIATGIPFVFCCLIYTLLYWTYPKDRDNARAAAMMELQMERMAGVTGIFSSKAEYRSVKEDVDQTNVQIDEDDASNEKKAWGEKDHILSHGCES